MHAMSQITGIPGAAIIDRTEQAAAP
jgi:hypothetical protein